jgi:hypothetical protein
MRGKEAAIYKGICFTSHVSNRLKLTAGHTSEQSVIQESTGHNMQKVDEKTLEAMKAYTTG